MAIRIGILVSLFLSLPAQAGLVPEMKLSGSERAQIEPMQPAVMEFRFMDGETGKTVKDFGMLHAKPMHLVILSSDFASFAHVHPLFDPTTGIFQIPLNLPVGHPDNQDSSRAFPKAGRYHVFAEVKSTVFGMKRFRWDLEVAGNEVREGIEADPANEDGSITKYFDRAGGVSAPGAGYRARFSLTQTPGCGGTLVRIRMELNERTAEGGYAELTGMKPWLMMGGHALILSADGDTARSKRYEHTHSVMPEHGSTLEYSFFDRDDMPAGVYKIWAQFNHMDQILTFPVVFRYEPVERDESGCR